METRNPARDPRCTVAVATRGYDLVLEGTAQLVTDRPRHRRAGGATRFLF